MVLGGYGPELLREFLRELLRESFRVAPPNGLENTTINQLLGNRDDDDDAETIWARILDLHENAHHETRIFPEASNLDVVFTSGGGADTWGAWAEIADSAATTFTSRLTSDAHLTAIMPEDASIIDQIWMVEISYGAAHTIVSRMRVVSGAQNKLPAVSQQRIRSFHIPAGETVYYRMMDETGGGTLNVSLRYFLH